MSEIKATWYAVRPSTEQYEPVYLYTSSDPPVEADEYQRVLGQLAAATARAEAAEAWRADVPWSTLTNIVDAAFHLAKNTHDAELWAECAAVEDWMDAYGIGTNAEHAAQQDKVQR